jgi:hypothetical protein
MYVYCQIDSLRPDPEQLGSTLEMGTYLCDDGSCPNEGSGNQHFYHQIAIDPHMWVHVLWDQHPSHIRGDSGFDNPGNNPHVQTSYYQDMMRAYIEMSSPQRSKSTMWIDDWHFFKSSKSVEPNQNEESVCNIAVGYSPGKDRWMISWIDLSFSRENASTFEVRWSLNPITNANYANASPIDIIFPNPKTATGQNQVLVKKFLYSEQAYCKFRIPDLDESQYKKIYFAVKDVSQKGKHLGSYPWNDADGHNAPTQNIKIIDYDFVSNKDTKPSPPTILFK